MAIVLELLSRKNIPLKHFKFDQDYVCVGRDFNNDLRLDDPYICPSHMLVAIDPESGQLVVNDCQSINGIKVNNKYVKQTNLTSNDIIKIGRTRLRIIDTKVALPVAMPLSELEENLNWLNRVMLTVFLTVVCLAYMLISKYVNSIDDFNLISVLPSQLSQLAIICIWPFAIAGIAKISKKESNLVNQLNLTLIASLIIYALGLLQNIVIFNIHPGGWFSWLELLIFAAIVITFIWLSLFIAFHQPNKIRNMITAAASAIVLVPILALGYLKDDGFNSRPKYNPTLLAPIYNITGTVSSEKFVDHAESLFEHVDDLKND
ncbi:FHA domain-containing protein [Paraglaciecola aquimarina]|uniref:FHA domain-containing protein n=1 Tax=Paraglaciecola aquimarina TaxID=1235557 RepID=A0ABU3SZD2_9ALTE|nr:FHA domain-containing protein [Paraglaciecola aquimarina]MDU0355365.1 FHA domain-containing protein [Paraglaciecola aquimarina]